MVFPAETYKGVKKKNVKKKVLINTVHVVNLQRKKRRGQEKLKESICVKS